VGAKLLDTKGEGIAYGQWQYGGRVEMRYVDRDITPEKDEAVVTSDESDSQTAQIPPAIIIGKVTGEPKVDNQGDSQTIQILPATNFDDLSIVAVIVSDGDDQNGS
jgi:cell shape-determining protein MreC